MSIVQVNEPHLAAPLIFGIVYGYLHPDKPSPSTDSKLTDLLVDSLDYLEFFMELENENEKLKFSDNEVASMKDMTVNDLVDRMVEKLRS